MPVNKKIIVAIGLPVAILGWIAFRPELLFINAKVNEAAPVSKKSVISLATGNFSSLAHETTGKAQIIDVDGKKLVRLTEFNTSNGPDVRVYLVRGSDGAKVDDTSLELGSLKGNVGDQNYEVPAGTNLDSYRSISIWCKRFSVAFGAASLTPVTRKTQYGQAKNDFILASFSPPIEVTAGTLKGDPRIAGKAALIEENGSRYLRLDLKSLPSGGYELRLLKQESAAIGLLNEKTLFVPLGLAKVGTTKVTISKEIDAWLYRSVVLFDLKSRKILAASNLRSTQERKRAYYAI